MKIDPITFIKAHLSPENNCCCFLLHENQIKADTIQDSKFKWMDYDNTQIICSQIMERYNVYYNVLHDKVVDTFTKASLDDAAYIMKQLLMDFEEP